MLFRSREEQVLDHIRNEIETRLNIAEIPREIREFLLDKWSYLLAGIFLRSGDQHPDWEAGWQTVDALLWSLLPKRDREETGQLVRLLPTLLERLQSGCDAMEYESNKRDVLFSTLAVLHAGVVGSGLQTRHGEEGQANKLGKLGVSDEEMADLIKGMATDDRASSTVAATRQGSECDRLKLGDAMRLSTADGEKILYLQWVNPTGGIYLFTDAEGFDAVSLTRARLLERLRSGEARLIQE